MTQAAASSEAQLAAAVADFYADPLGFVYFAYPWPIKGEAGPNAWQCEALEALGAMVRERGFDGQHTVDPIRCALSTGHGVGKTAFFAWIVDWAMSTRPNLHGTVTANTNDQLEHKTWAAVREWTALCVTASWFEINSQIMYRKGHRASWFITPQSCAEENSEAFAGQHAKDSTSIYLFDEASAIPRKIWEVAEGGLTDGEPMMIAGGNPTRNTGSFFDAVFGRLRNRWWSKIIDARTVLFHNARLVSEWQEDYGEDSDFFRVRVRGLAPLASEAQYIDSDRIEAAQRRAHVEVLADEPLVVGVDVSGGGSAWTVARFRRGFDARSIPPVRISGEASRDRGLIVAALAEILETSYQGVPVSAMFIDSAFGAAVVERLHALGYKDEVHEINFGGIAPDSQHCANMRAFMWKKMKEWLEHAALPVSDTRLVTDLTAPGFHLDKKNRLVLEAKDSIIERGFASPDDGDGQALTFARPVRRLQRGFPGQRGGFRSSNPSGNMAWAG
jgi:hypothetical protein